MNELNEQDLRVLRLYAQNKTISQIAETLGIRFEAAHFRIRRLHERFGTSRRHELLEAARHYTNSDASFDANPGDLPRQ